MHSIVRENPSKLKQLIYSVSQCESLSENISRIFLHSPENDVISFLAGQYVKVVHSQGELSPLSIACAPSHAQLIELHLSHSPENLYAQDILKMINCHRALTVRGAYGSCTSSKLFSDRRPIIFLARGTGFAPIKAIIEDLQQQQNSPKMHLFWSASSSHELYLHDLVSQWADEIRNFSYTPLLSRDEINWHVFNPPSLSLFIIPETSASIDITVPILPIIARTAHYFREIAQF